MSGRRSLLRKKNTTPPTGNTEEDMEYAMRTLDQQSSPLPRLMGNSQSQTQHDQQSQQQRQQHDDDQQQHGHQGQQPQQQENLDQSHSQEQKQNDTAPKQFPNQFTGQFSTSLSTPGAFPPNALPPVVLPALAQNTNTNVNPSNSTNAVLSSPSVMPQPVHPKMDVDMFFADRNSTNINNNTSSRSRLSTFGLLNDRILPRPLGTSPILPYTGPGIRPPFSQQQHLRSMNLPPPLPTTSTYAATTTTATSAINTSSLSLSGAGADPRTSLLNHQAPSVSITQGAQHMPPAKANAFSMSATGSPIGSANAVGGNGGETGVVTKNATKRIKKKKTDMRPYDCPYCSLKFKRKHHLNRHVSNLHFGLKPYKCPACWDPPASFDQLPNLDRHMTSVHQQTFQFACEFCMFRFRGRRERNKHMAQDHAAEKTAKRKKKILQKQQQQQQQEEQQTQIQQ